MKVLVIAAHADDEVLGCGGTIARHVAQGHRVTVGVVTSGSASVFDEATLKTIRAEAIEAGRRLGVAHTEFLEFEAPLLDVTPRHKIADAIARLLSREQPDEVFVPHGGDIHHDHQAVFWSALVACRPVSSGAPARILAYETLSETEWAPSAGGHAFVPNVFEDIGATLDAKCEAMRAYASQLRAAPHPRSIEAIRALARVRGSTVNLAAAEAFVLLREVRRP